MILNEDMIAISVIIATYNRCEDLRLALGCLRDQALPPGVDYEVLIVDNNSNDNTREVVESFAPLFRGRLRYLHEQTQGQPFAHNKGIKEATGEIVVLTDDDCTFDADHLGKVYSTFKENGDAVGFIGGKCSPRWVNCSKPAWFSELEPGWWSEEFFWGPLAILDYGDEPFILDHHHIDNGNKKLLYGANIAVRKILFSRHGYFDVRRTVTQDTELQLRFLRNGERGLYAPRVRVYHKVSPDRLSRHYFYRWYYRRGNLLEVEETRLRNDYNLFGIKLSLILATVRSLVGSVLTLSETKTIYRRCHALFNLGQMNQIVRRKFGDNARG